MAFKLSGHPFRFSLRALLLLFFALAPSLARAATFPLSLAESTPYAPLRISDWLVDDGTTTLITEAAAPQFGQLDLTPGAERYVPSAAFDSVGLDHFAIDAMQSVGGYTVGQNRYWFVVSRASSRVTAKFVEDFETSLQTSPVPWRQQGDVSALQSSAVQPIEGAASLRITDSGVASFLRLHPSGDGVPTDPTDGNNGQSLYGEADMPPPDYLADPIPIVGFSTDRKRQGGIEVRAIDRTWQARAFGESIDGTGRRETAWYSIPHDQPVRFGLEWGLAIAERPSHGGYLFFEVSTADGVLGSETLMELEPDLLVGVDIGILDDTGQTGSSFVFDSIEFHQYLASAPRVRTETFETGTFDESWDIDPGPLSIVSKKPSLFGNYEMNVDLAAANTDDVALIDFFSPTDEVVSSFLLDIDALGLLPGDRLSLWSIHEDSQTFEPWIALVEVRRTSLGTIVIRSRTRNDHGLLLPSGWHELSRGTHRVTVRWQALATGGGTRIAIDDALVLAGPSVVNGDSAARSVRLGASDVATTTELGAAANPLLRLDNLVTTARRGLLH